MNVEFLSLLFYCFQSNRIHPQMLIVGLVLRGGIDVSASIFALMIICSRAIMKSCVENVSPGLRHLPLSKFQSNAIPLSLWT